MRHLLFGVQLVLWSGIMALALSAHLSEREKDWPRATYYVCWIIAFALMLQVLP